MDFLYFIFSGHRQNPWSRTPTRGKRLISKVYLGYFGTVRVGLWHLKIMNAPFYTITYPTVPSERWSWRYTLYRTENINNTGEMLYVFRSALGDPDNDSYLSSFGPWEPVVLTILLVTIVTPSEFTKDTVSKSLVSIIDNTLTNEARSVHTFCEISEIELIKSEVFYSFNSECFPLWYNIL